MALGMDWRSASACRNSDPDLFFPVSSSGLAAERQLAEAKAVCAHCPVGAECREFALRTRQAHGVWGGLSEQELQDLWRFQVRPTNPGAGNRRPVRTQADRCCPVSVKLASRRAPDLDWPT